MQPVIGDGNLALRDRDGPGPVVLWIHGYTMSSEVWEPLWDALQGMRHVGIDLPGHGASPPMPNNLTLPCLGDQIAAIASQYGAEHLVGISYGGMIALQVAAAMGDTLATLVVASPSLGGGPLEPAVQTRNLELFRMYGQYGPGPWLRERWMTSPPDVFRGAQAHPQLWARLCRIISSHTWDELKDARMHRLVSHDQSRELARIRAKTIVAVGTEDMPASKRTAELIRRGVRGSRRIQIDAGHLTLLEAPDVVAPMIAQHIFTTPGVATRLEKGEK